MLNLQAKSSCTIRRCVTSYANRLISGIQKIGSYFPTAVVTAGRDQYHSDRAGGGGGGGLPPRLNPALGSGKASP